VLQALGEAVFTPQGAAEHVHVACSGE
jgi:hypothetical protein